MKSQYLALIALVLLACSEPKKEGIAGKKEELAELKKQQSELNAKVTALQAEVTKLDPQAQEAAKTKTVAVTPVTTSTFQHFIEVQGTVDAKNNVLVTPKSGGAVTAVYVKEGDIVRAGQTLAKVDDQILRESVAEIRNQWELANTLFEKQGNLWKQQIGTELQYLQAKNNKDGLERRLVTLNTQLAQANITSPISGVVDQVNIKPGETAMPGMGVVRVVNLSQLKVVAKVADTYVGSVKKGSLVKVKFPDSNKEINARVSFVSTTVDPLSRTFEIEATLPGSSQLKPNQLAVVNINDVNKPNAIVINQNLIQNTEKGQVVYVAVADGNKKAAKAKVVKTGQSYNGQVEITDGLQVGDQIVTQGYQELVDGQPISF
ncbi:MAG: efflux RND transporter periplasmic adaptor subunit [Cytophagaceae bacterium]|nr:efflux RND transporter periplasmic adaptor subunit [Cytophagaceae bacterium]